MKIVSRGLIGLIATASTLSKIDGFNFRMSILPTFGLNSKKATNHDVKAATLAPVADSIGTLAVNGDTANDSNSKNARRRRPIVAGNWKLNPSTRDEALELLRGVAAWRAARDDDDDVEVVVFPPLPFLGDAVAALREAGVGVGAQNAGAYDDGGGAFTGEIAPSMLASAGCGHVLLGHSERRSLFGETDDEVGARARACLAVPSLSVVLCVGETLEEYEAGAMEAVVDRQLRAGLAGVSAEDVAERVVVAYEPVWAIGTGLTATPEQAQVAHAAVRATLAAIYSTATADAVRVQYGGSVKPDSVADLVRMPDVDGALVGGASLDATSFADIVDGAARATNDDDASPTTTRFHHAALSYFDVALLTPKGPRKGADVGSPHDSTRPLVKGDVLSAGSWWCAEGGWPSPTPRATTEIFTVLSGHACVTDAGDGTRSFFGPGDTVVLPKGWAGRWDVLEDIHKVWVVVDGEDDDDDDAKTSSIVVHHRDAVSSTTTTTTIFLDNGHANVGTWSAHAPGSLIVTRQEHTEAHHFLEGVAFLTNDDGEGTARRCVAGDTVVLPKGWAGRWDFMETVKTIRVVASSD